MTRDATGRDADVIHRGRRWRLGDLELRKIKRLGGRALVMTYRAVLCCGYVVHGGIHTQRIGGLVGAQFVVTLHTVPGDLTGEIAVQFRARKAGRRNVGPSWIQARQMTGVTIRRRCYC